jgi:monothiol glutaredoxin
MNLEEGARSQLDTLIRAHDVTLFMKGTRQQPQCGFSNTVIQILDSLITDYQTVDVLADSALRENIKAYSAWPTIPQLYVKGEFIGGCDIIQELFQSGELAGTFGIELPAPGDVTITISDGAADQLRTVIEQQGGPGRELQLSIDARLQANLFLGPVSGNEIVAESNGVELRLDLISASRAHGISIDVVDTPQGPGFKIDNPAAPEEA